jgi:hypothetical protein
MLMNLPGGLVVVTLPILERAVPSLEWDQGVRSYRMSPVVELMGLVRERREQLSSQSTPSPLPLSPAAKVKL